MSEQTPTSTEGLKGAEPSMEDILASIRKIISEDEPVAMESPEDVPPVELVSAEPTVLAEEPLSASDAVSDVAEMELGTSDGDSVDLNIDDVLAELADEDLAQSDGFAEDDLKIPEIPDDASEDFSIDSLMSEINVPDAVSDAVPENLAENLAENVTDKFSDTVDVAFDNDDEVLAFLDSDMAAVAGGAAAAGAAGALVKGKMSPDLTPDLSDLLGSGGDINDASSEMDNLLPETEVVSRDVEMDALLDDILSAPDAVAEEVNDDALEDIISEDVISDEDIDALALEPEGLSEAEQSDLDLVKSLMAELADDPSFEEGEDLDALIDLDGAEEEADIGDVSVDEFEPTEALSELAADTEDEDILGEILDMSLEDELKNQADDLALEELELGDLASLDAVAAAEQENVLENVIEDIPAEDPIELDAAIEETVTELPSLAEIAAAAESDALAVETASSAQPTVAALGVAAAAGAGVAALGAKAVNHTEAEPAAAEVEAIEADAIDLVADEIESGEIETTDIEMGEVETSIVETPVETTTEKQTLPTQETSMPLEAVKTDAIIDEVTETATTGAFAELNQVVEDKAVFNERGPRIGDLVQDALRPMLKEWLDANLKGIVERAVTKEVKRISKGS